ncbi:hypothetical protein [Asticcacaulis taihuensis]|uniref:hypothetical protein n=1 Tax=Asticcacaulis taihuensis TaxID=260084 RepID=UPI003F7C10F9
MSKTIPTEGLGLVRFVLVWSSLSPVFVLWAFRGVASIPDKYWIPGCLALFMMPTAILYALFNKAKQTKNVKTIKIYSSKDQREHLLTYLFAMIIPLFQASLGSIRDILSIFAAFFLIMFLFWHMRLHYMNILFAIFGFKIFSVEVRVGTSEEERKQGRISSYVVISRRHIIPDGSNLTGYRLGGGVLVDEAVDD